MLNADDISQVKSEKDEWIKKAGCQQDAEIFHTTPSGIKIKNLYTPEDVSNLDYLKDLGFPGSYPYTRGVYPTMYLGRPWTLRLFSGFATPE